MTFLEAALMYAAAGWHVFPLKPRDKVPATAHGFKDATTDKAAIENWWKENPQFNIGLATGEASGLFVLDLDTKHGKSVDLLLEPYGGIKVLPDSPCVKTGTGGMHAYFRYPSGSRLTISGGKLGLGIDTRGEGGYVVAPPSIHPNGNEYQWIDADSDTLADCPAWIVQRLTRQKAAAAITSAEKLTGGRHQTMMTYAALMRSMGAAQPEIEAALHKLVLRLDLSDGRVIERKEIEDISTWTGDKSMGVVNVESVLHGEAAIKSILTNYGDAVPEAAKHLVITDPGAFPADLMKPPGLIADLVEHIELGAIKSQPVLALGAAIALMGVLAGRRFKSPRGTRTNVYVINIAESGAGKERGRSVIKNLLYKAGGENLIGAEDIASEAAVIEVLDQSPSTIFPLDEMGRMLRTMNNPQASPHLFAIITLFLRLFSSANGVYVAKAYADKKRNRVIVQPNMVLLGTTVPRSMWEGLTTESVTDGFLARVLPFQGDNMPPSRPFIPGSQEIPEELVAAVRAWVQMPLPGGNLATVHPEPVTVDKTREALDLFEGMQAMAAKEQAALRSELATLWTRCEEKADQLALIYAASVNREAPTVDAAAASWATRTAEYLTRRVIWEASRNLARNAREAEANRIVKAIDDAGEKGISRSPLLRQFRHLRAQELTDLLSTLVESKEISTHIVTSKGGSYLVYRSGNRGSAEAA